MSTSNVGLVRRETSSGVNVYEEAKTRLPMTPANELSNYLDSLIPVRPWYHRRDVSRLAEPVYLRFKRLLDIAVSLIALPLIAPVLVLCTVAIKLDSPGPVVFRQKRTGRGGRRFLMYKLRTMVQNAEEQKESCAHLNDLSYPDFKIRNDPRVTRVGRILRKTSLDELPEFINVLWGDMSLVGPRPTSFRAATYSLWHTARLDIQSGITGLWQVSGRSELGFDERLRLDIAYARNRCISLDLEVLWRTVGAVLGGRGAD